MSIDTSAMRHRNWPGIKGVGSVRCFFGCCALQPIAGINVFNPSDADRKSGSILVHLIESERLPAKGLGDLRQTMNAKSNAPWTNASPHRRLSGIDWQTYQKKKHSQIQKRKIGSPHSTYRRHKAASSHGARRTVTKLDHTRRSAQKCRIKGRWQHIFASHYAKHWASNAGYK